MVLRSPIKSPLSSPLRSTFGGEEEGAQVAAFSFQPETNTLAANLGVAPTDREKRIYDRFYRRLKADGILSKTSLVWAMGATEEASLTWLNAPATKMTKVGSPTFKANESWTGVATTGYLNSQLNASTLLQNNVGAYVWCATTGASSNNDMGATNAASEGITIASRRATDNNLGIRLAGAFDQVSAVADSDGYGLNGGSRSNSSQVTGQRNGVQKNTVSRPSAALPSLNIFFCTNNGNGTPSTATPREIAAGWLGQALTENECRNLTGALGEYLEFAQFGRPYIEEPGIGTAVVTKTVGFYGFNIASICGAYDALRAGAPSVCIIGGWRDWYNPGGTTTGGLGWVDYDDLTALGGIPRWFITRCNQLQGVADTTFKLRSVIARRVCWEILDNIKNGGFDIPVFLTNGVVSGQKTGAALNSITCTDGRVFNCSQWVDSSYEQDLARIAGINFTKGREAAGSGVEANNGVKLSATDLLFNPWNTVNTPASGLIPFVTGVRTVHGGAVDTVGPDGTADSHIQPPNFRMTVTNVADRRVPFSSTPPAGHVATDYEFLHRFLAANAAVDTFGELFKEDLIYNNTFDANNEGFVSSDFVSGGMDAYPAANYATRETIWKNCEKYLRGFLYECQYGTDPRIPAALKTSMASWGLLQDHYYSPHPNDQMFWMTQMYVRECWRMVSDFILNGNHLAETDGITPSYGDHTIAVVSYQTDSHAPQRVAHETSPGVWTTKNEGGFGADTGNTNNRAPVPYEACVPKASECTNVSVTFGISSTHAAFGAYRMEPTFWMAGQSMGRAAALAAAGDGIIQNVSYATLRTGLLASASLTGEVAPVLPQVN